MSEKQFFEIDYDEIYYIVDSSRLQKKKADFEDEEEYQQYCLENSLIGTQVVDLLNSLVEENEELKRKLEYCEHERFLDGLGGSNKWFGMGGF